MQLRCKVCGDLQPVTTADAEDEDPRTQGIRRAFRTEHLERCGAGSVALQLFEPDLEPVDDGAWTAYLASVQPPPDVTVSGDGMFLRTILRDGATRSVYVCESCWQTIPRYVDFPFGLTSPESDGAGGVVPKVRPATTETSNPNRSQALEHVRKAVCLPCYLEAFSRVYPDAPLPFLRPDVVGDGTPIEPAAAPDASTLGRETRTDWREQVVA